MSADPSAAKGSDGHGGGRRPTVVWIVAAVAACLLLVWSVRAQHKVAHQEAFCATSCHHQSEAGSTKSHPRGHEKLECQQCHQVSLGAGTKLYLQSLFGSKQPTKHGKVEPSACRTCHEERPEDSLLAQTKGHREHVKAKDVDCLSCHGKATHGGEPADKSCVRCHDGKRIHRPTTAADAETCLSCHTYAASPERAGQPTPLLCQRCHVDQDKLAGSAGGTAVRPMKPVDQHTLHGKVACQLCHNPHGIKPKLPEDEASCAQCHRFQIFLTGREEKKGPAEHYKCEGCHKPHAPKKHALDSCVNCHEKNAKGLVSVQLPAGKTTALRHRSCASCHLPHSWKAERSGCVQCHDDKARLLLTKSPPQHNACTNCHEVHGAPPTGAVCVDCHKKTKGNHVALAPQKHKDCTSCHDPHAPLPKDTRNACAKCHTPQLTQLVRDGPEGHTRGSCFGCHLPHDNPRPPPSLCAKCHEEKGKTVAAAGPPKHRLCLSCHEAHKFKIKDPTVACSKCHGAALAATAGAKKPHQGDCKNCHTLHGSPGVPKAACLKCHDKVAAVFKAPNEKHNACGSCHKPHTAASNAPTACATCHAAKATVAAAWPAASAHAKACNGCHQPHDVKTKKGCAECHAKEAGSASGGKHQCQQCHPPHASPPGTGPAWWGRCKDCHGNKVEAVKARGTTHASCENCHKPHNFAPPACASCHKMGAKGLHASEKHTKCTACHDAHAKSEPTPKQCLACHTNKTNHEPGAKKCQACHMFN